MRKVLLFVCLLMAGVSQRKRCKTKSQARHLNRYGRLEGLQCP